MRVAIATPILYDSTSPFNHLFKDIIGGFLDAGYEVIRLVAVSNDEEFGYKLGYETVEYRKYRRKESSHSNIFARYLRDILTNVRQAKDLNRVGADVLFEDVSYSSYWAVRAAKKNGMRVVAMLQDIWPDNAVQSGLIKQGGLLYKFFEFWQRSVYKHADKIICISDDMKDFITSKGVDSKKIEVIYNWGYSDKTVDIAWEDNLFVKKYNLGKDFYAVYAGNIGKMQNLELVVRAAKKLPETKFLIIGDGVRQKEIERMTEKINNITMLPLQPPELAEHIYSMAGVNIIPLVEGGIKTAMPSKIAVVLSCGMPVIFCFGSESRFGRIVEEYGAGVSVSASDEDELIEAIRSVKRGNGGKKLFMDRFQQSGSIKKYVEAVGL